MESTEGRVTKEEQRGEAGETGTVILETEQSLPQPETPAPREVTAATIGRMMGLVTTSDLKLLEGKIDLLTTRMSTVGSKLERLSTQVQNAPSGSDLERIDVQIGALRTMIRDAMDALSTPVSRKESSDVDASNSTAPERNARIISSSDE